MRHRTPATESAVALAKAEAGLRKASGPERTIPRQRDDPAHAGEPIPCASPALPRSDAGGGLTHGDTIPGPIDCPAVESATYQACGDCVPLTQARLVNNWNAWIGTGYLQPWRKNGIGYLRPLTLRTGSSLATEAPATNAGMSRCTSVRGEPPSAIQVSSAKSFLAKSTGFMR